MNAEGKYHEKFNFPYGSGADLPIREITI